MNFEKFLKLEAYDFKERTLEEIWGYSDNEINHTHDFIQIVFPLNKPSNSSFHGYYLDDALLIENIKGNKVISQNLIKSSQWFLSFLKRNQDWRNPSNHNQLRITRVIECLRLLVSDEMADKFYQDVLQVLGDDSHINKRTLAFWKNA